MSSFPKKPALVHNAIPDQLKTAANSLTIQEWNAVVNTLKQQANLNTAYIEQLHRVLFFNYDQNTSGYVDIPDIFEEGFLSNVMAAVAQVVQQRPLQIYESINSFPQPGIAGDLYLAKFKTVVIDETPTQVVANELYYWSETLDAYRMIVGTGGTGSGADHSQLSLESRALPNQHPIKSIIGLEQKVNIHVGPNAPTYPANTWLRPVVPGQEPPAADTWQVLVSTPLIRYGHVIEPDAFDSNAPIRLIVIGVIDGSNYSQELHMESSYIRGEVVLFLDTNDPSTSLAAEIELHLVAGKFYVTGFRSTGALLFNQFYAHRIEVYV
jgi:hypothetical protein